MASATATSSTTPSATIANESKCDKLKCGGPSQRASVRVKRVRTFDDIGAANLKRLKSDVGKEEVSVLSGDTQWTPSNNAWTVRFRPPTLDDIERIYPWLRYIFTWKLTIGYASSALSSSSSSSSSASSSAGDVVDAYPMPTEMLTCEIRAMGKGVTKLKVPKKKDCVAFVVATAYDDHPLKTLRITFKENDPIGQWTPLLD